VRADTFNIHEDDWGMIHVVPSENAAERAAAVQTARDFGDAHQAPGGLGWTAPHVVPEPEHTIGQRGIAIAELEALLGRGWSRYAAVGSGYGPPPYEKVPRGYAFGDGTHVVYGSVDDANVVASVNISKLTPGLAETLVRLGRAQRLMAVDLWRDCVVLLDDEAAVAEWLREDDT
jgi:hypothetical protein